MQTKNRGLNLEELKNRQFQNEEQLQAASFDLITGYFPEFYLKAFHPKNEQHIPKYVNESERDYKKRSAMIGGVNKRKGKLSGVMDIILRKYGVMLTIELKLEKERNTKNGGLSPAQVELRNEWALDFPDCPPFIAYNLFELYNILVWFLAQGFRVVKGTN